MEELVSIIITTYKRKQEFKRALVSALNQDYPFFEIIVIDDNVETNISEYVQKMIREISNDSRVRYYKNSSNLGGALSRNEGILRSQGKYIAFLDDDDEFLPQKIREQVECFKESSLDKLGVVYCHTVGVNNELQVMDRYEKNIRGDYLFEQMKENIAATTQLMVLSSVLKEIGGFRDVPSKQDATLLIDIAVAGYQIDVVPRILSRYYESDIQRISGTGRKNLQGELLYREHIRKNYAGLSEEEIHESEYNNTIRIYYYQLINKMWREADDSARILIQNWTGKGNIFLFRFKHLARKIKWKLISK